MEIKLNGFTLKFCGQPLEAVLLFLAAGLQFEWNFH